LWKTINKILNHNSKSSHQIPQQICVNNKIICDIKKLVMHSMIILLMLVIL